MKKINHFGLLGAIVLGVPSTGINAQPNRIVTPPIIANICSDTERDLTLKEYTNCELAIMANQGFEPAEFENRIVEKISGKVSRTNNFIMRLAGTNTDETVGAILPQVSLRADVDGTDAKFSLSNVSDSLSGIGSTNFNISFNTPIEKKQNRGDFLTENGLPNKLGLSVSINKSLVPLTINDFDRSLLNENGRFGLFYRAKCLEYTKLKVEDLRPRKKSSWDAVQNLRCGINTPIQNRSAQLTLDVLNLHDESIAKKLVAGINGNLGQLAKSVLEKPLHLVNFSGSWGIEDFEHRDPLNFSKMKGRKSSYSFAASYGYMPQLKKPLFLAFGGEYKSYYKAPDKLIKCQSNTTGSPLDCIHAVFGPPEKEKDAKVFAVARYGGPKQGFAIEFKGAYDAKDDDWGLEVPIYLVRDAKDKLTGGFRFVYDSDDGSGKEDWKVGLFISQPFDLSKLGI